MGYKNVVFDSISFNYSSVKGTENLVHSCYDLWPFSGFFTKPSLVDVIPLADCTILSSFLILSVIFAHATSRPNPSNTNNNLTKANQKNIMICPLWHCALFSISEWLLDRVAPVSGDRRITFLPI